MKLIALFFAPGLLAAAGLQLHDQHRQGLGWLPQQQAITQAAAWVTRTICPAPR